ncbi:MAG: hypothetical protein H7199_10000 [Burkholderiales bacterium]|nr:hypothetical protein [Flavobacterium sp.]
MKTNPKNRTVGGELAIDSIAEDAQRNQNTGSAQYKGVDKEPPHRSRTNQNLVVNKRREANLNK